LIITAKDFNRLDAHYVAKPSAPKTIHNALVLAVVVLIVVVVTTTTTTTTTTTAVTTTTTTNNNNNNSSSYNKTKAYIQIN